ncbi:MAG: NYN domain-containing protein [Candidatus Sungbacteria bacterium]|nr:NYN domain-containing protein [Candidatus Sungbacteria bacterium]
MNKNPKSKKAKDPAVAVKDFLEELLVDVESRLIGRLGEVVATEKTLTELRQEIANKLGAQIHGTTGNVSTYSEKTDERLKTVETSIIKLGSTVKGLESVIQSKLDRLFNQVSLSRRTAVFVDGQNLEGATLRVFPGMRTSFDKLLKVLNWYGKCLAVRAYFSEEVSDGDVDREARIDRRRSFFRALEGFGYYIYVKTKKLITRNDGSVVGKANCDVELTVDMMELASSGRFDCVILVAGDSDYAYLLQRMRQKGIYTIVFFTEESLSFELRESCDMFVSLESELISKEVMSVRSESKIRAKAVKVRSPELSVVPRPISVNLNNEGDDDI